MSALSGCSASNASSYWLGAHWTLL